MKIFQKKKKKKKVLRLLGKENSLQYFFEKNIGAIFSAQIFFSKNPEGLKLQGNFLTV